jgi:hypothetical protein
MTAAVTAPVAVAVIPSTIVVTIHLVVVVTILTALTAIAILSAHRQAYDAEDH